MAIDASNITNPTDVTIPDLKTTNSSIGIIDNLFGGIPNGFYETFYSAFLTTANALPINSMWIVTIDNIPSNPIDKILQTYEGWKVTNSSAIATNVNRKDKMGLIVAQGVKVVGDSSEVIRTGTKNTGYIQGLVGQGRTGFPLLNIAFVENNLSFVDYVLRPWSIAVSHASLKDPTLKSTISVIFLTKTGPRQDLAMRKIVRYWNCCPISINEEEYNYSGSDMYRLRQAQFAFSHYTMEEDASGVLLSLIGASGTERDMFSTLQNRLKNELQRQFGANSPTQYINNLVDRAKKFGSNLITGTATNIVTNVAGTIQGKIEHAITGIESTVAGGATKLVNSVNDATNRALGNVTRSDSRNLPSATINDSIAASIDTARKIGANKAAFGGYVEKTTPKDDYTQHLHTLEPSIPGAPAVVDTNKQINQNDTPNHVQSVDINDPNSITAYLRAGRSNNQTAQDPNADTVMLNTKLKYNLRKPDPPMDDVRHGDINHQDVEKKINQNDYITGLQVNQNDKLINQDDYVKNLSLVNSTDKSINQDDYVKNHSLNSSTDKLINQNDVPNHNNIKFIIKTVDQADVPTR